MLSSAVLPQLFFDGCGLRQSNRDGSLSDISVTCKLKGTWFKRTYVMGFSVRVKCLMFDATGFRQTSVRHYMMCQTKRVDSN